MNCNVKSVKSILMKILSMSNVIQEDIMNLLEFYEFSLYFFSIQLRLEYNELV